MHTYDGLSPRDFDPDNPISVLKAQIIRSQNGKDCATLTIPINLAFRRWFPEEYQNITKSETRGCQCPHCGESTSVTLVENQWIINRHMSSLGGFCAGEGMAASLGDLF